VKSSKEVGYLNIYTYQIVSNPHHLVFYSEHVQRTFLGYATNWNITGYYEYSYPLRK